MGEIQGWEREHNAENWQGEQRKWKFTSFENGLLLGELDIEHPEILLTLPPFLEELFCRYRHIKLCPNIHGLLEVSSLTLAQQAPCSLRCCLPLIFFFIYWGIYGHLLDSICQTIRINITSINIRIYYLFDVLILCPFSINPIIGTVGKYN